MAEARQTRRGRLPASRAARTARSPTAPVRALTRWAAPLSLCLSAGLAVAAPPVVVVGMAPDGAEAQALRDGAEVDAAAHRATAEALARADQAFLEMDYRAAEADLSQAVNDELSRPERPLNVDRAFRATVRLGQVLLASGRKQAAVRLMAQALRSWPGFPGRASPPPDVGRVIERARRALPAGEGLRIDSQPSGEPARVNGVPVGTTPLQLDGFVGQGARVCVDGPTGARCATAVGPEVTVVADAAGARARLADAVLRGDAEAGWPALAQFQRSLRATEICLVVRRPSGVTVARADGEGRTLLGGDVVPAPAGVSGWQAIGGRCRPEAVAGSAARVEAALWQGGPHSGGPDTRQILGWSATGAGVAAAAVGVGFGLSANDAADAYNRTGASADEDRARGQALVADVAYVGAAVLVATGLYLLLTD